MHQVSDRMTPLALLLLFICGLPLHATAQTPPVDAIIYTTRGEIPLKLITAATPEERRVGVMNRDTLKPFDGMLFLFPDENDYSFWMKDTRIPLDMIFVDARQTIVHVESDVEPYSLRKRNCGRKVNAVIELDGGRAAREGIAAGDNVRYELPKNMEIH